MADQRIVRIPDPVRIERKGRVAMVVIDAPGEAGNVVNDQFCAAFETALSVLERADDVRAIVFISGKPSAFISGVDLHTLEAIRTAEEGERLARLGQTSTKRVARLTVPTVAAIHGTCLGRGLELALACDARIATRHRATRFGLPDVTLGVLPCAGGTQRLPRLIGLSSALDLILTGKQVDAARAKTLGLVDEVVPPALLRELAIERALCLADKPGRNPLGRLSSALAGLLGEGELQGLLLEDNPFGRKVLFDTAKKTLLAARPPSGQGAAPLAALEVIKTGASRGMKAGLAAEATAFGALVVSPIARQLVAASFARAAVIADSGVDDGSIVPRAVDKVGVVGAGTVGASIAYVTAGRAGAGVRLLGRRTKNVARCMAHIRDMFDAQVERGRITERKRDDIMARISPTARVTGLGSAQLVMDAGADDLSLTQKTLRQVEQAGPPDIIFAPTTSTLPLSKIAEASAHPETVIGMHYGTPAHTAPLLEVVRTKRTAPWVVATCVALGKRQGKTVVVVGGGVGFYAARVRAPYMNEALHLLAEGIPVDVIDAALVSFGFPVGPLALLDEVGLDAAQGISILMGASFGARSQQPPGLARLVADERMGKAGGKGFYRYDGKHTGVDRTVYKVLDVAPTRSVAATEIARRCVLQLVNEAAYCLGDGVLRSARDGDVAAVAGLGFPAFRGGPFRYVDALGPARVVAQLREYEAAHGRRYAPAPTLVTLADRGEGFYPPRASRAARPGNRPPTGMRA